MTDLKTPNPTPAPLVAPGLDARGTFSAGESLYRIRAREIVREIERLTEELRTVEAKANFEEGFARLQSSRHRAQTEQAQTEQP